MEKTVKRDVWITGIGTINPLGAGYAAAKEKLLAGACGITTVKDFAIPDHLSRIAGRISSIPVPEKMAAADFQKRLPLEQILLGSCIQAFESADLWDERADQDVGLALGLGAEWMFRWEHGRCQGDATASGGQSVLRGVQSALGLQGPAVTVAAACASGNYALAQARAWIRMGWVDVCLAGAAESFVTPMSMSSFGNMRALSCRNLDPQRASRPFDRDRDGFVMGEGGGVFVLEAAEHARKRGARPYAELAGFGATSNAFHMVIPSPDPEPAVLAMRQALGDAQIDRDDVDYVNAHATSTLAGDTAECRILNMVFGERTRTLPVSSTKSMTGHLLSGAAVMNALACLVALEQQALPPTINLCDPDPQCNVCHVPNEAQPRPVRIAVSNSLGFGGSNTCIVLRKVA